MKPPLARSNSTPQSRSTPLSSYLKRTYKTTQISPYNIITLHNSNNKHDAAASEAEWGSNLWGRRGSAQDRNREEIGNQLPVSQSNNQNYSVVQDDWVKRPGIRTELRAAPQSGKQPDPNLKKVAGNPKAMELSNPIHRLSMSAELQTKQLTDTYNSITEKLEGLQAMVSRFSDLEKSTTRLLEAFDANDERYQMDMRSQIKALGAYQEEIGAIRVLQGRLDIQRKMVGIYKTRLEKVQQEIGKQKQMEVLWRQRASKRLRILWIVISVLVILWLLATSTHDGPSLGLDDADEVEDMDDTLDNPSTEFLNQGPVPKDVLSAEAEQILRERHVQFAYQQP